MNLQLPYETLHGHTVYSDGLMTHREVLDLCRDNEIGIIAFTDHEAVLDESKFNELKKLGHTVRFISGIELTFNAYDGVRMPATESGHLVGLFVDPTDGALADFCKRAQQKRIDKIRHTVRELVNAGFDITVDDVAREVKGHSWAKPHLAAALIKKNTNLQRMDVLLEDMKQAAHTDPALKARYERILTHDATRRVFDLLLGSHPYIPVHVSELDENVDFDRIVQLIRGAGGAASLAHWFSVDNVLTTDELKKLVQSGRLDGFETRYGFYDPPEMQNGLIEQCDHLDSLAKELNCITTGGVDLHKKADLRNLRDPLFAQRRDSTRGMTARVLENMPQLSTKWTTL